MADKEKRMLQVSGKVIIIVDDQPEQAHRLQYGFVKVKGMEDVFFNALSSFVNTSFEDLRTGDRVTMTVQQTSRGPYAKSLTLSLRQSKKQNPVQPRVRL